MLVMASSALRRKIAKQWRGASIFIAMFKEFFFNFCPLNIYIYIYILIYLFIWLCWVFSCGMWALLLEAFWVVVAYRIQFLDQGLKPGPLHWECGVLATAPQGRPKGSFFN